MLVGIHHHTPPGTQVPNDGAGKRPNNQGYLSSFTDINPQADGYTASISPGSIPQVS